MPVALHPLRLQPFGGKADRMLSGWLSGVWLGWHSALYLVKPETVIGWASARLPSVVDAGKSTPE